MIKFYSEYDCFDEYVLDPHRSSSVGSSPIQGRVSKLSGDSDPVIQELASTLLSHHVQQPIPFDGAHLAELHQLSLTTQSARIQEVERSIVGHITESARPHAQALVRQLSDPSRDSVHKFFQAHTVGEVNFFVSVR